MGADYVNLLAVLRELRAALDQAIAHLEPLVPVLEVWTASRGTAQEPQEHAPEPEHPPMPAEASSSPDGPPRPIGLNLPEQRDADHHLLRAVRHAGRTAAARCGAQVLHHHLSVGGEDRAHGAARGGPGSRAVARPG
jgi:hypothetical protein